MTLMAKRILILLVLAASLAGCVLKPKGDRTALQVHPDMDNQPKYKAQAPSAFFSDGRSNRLPPEGTIAQGRLREDEAFFTGKLNGAPVKTNPVPVTAELLKRGQERFNISCSPCHGRTGEGNGIVAQRAAGALVPANLQQERLRTVEDGHLYDVITNGIRTMQSLGHQVTEADRWAIVAYVRALQRSQNATVKDVPAGQTIK